MKLTTYGVDCLWSQCIQKWLSMELMTAYGVITQGTTTYGDAYGVIQYGTITYMWS